jgi:SPP1 family predicted phage head-tail adaptor
MLSDAELVQLRADVLELLPDDLVIQRATIAGNDYGDGLESWTTVATVKGRVDPLNTRGDSPLTADREAVIVERQISVVWDADLRAGDRLLWGGRYYQVKMLVDDQSKRAVRRAQVVEIR